VRASCPLDMYLITPGSAVSATILLAFNGRIAGISGMVNGAISFNIL